jgi:hypothetical protein
MPALKARLENSPIEDCSVFRYLELAESYLELGPKHGTFQ